MLHRLMRLKAAWQAPGTAGAEVTTAEDIEACFRLLLGRTPNPEERAGHFLQVGHALPAVVAGYLNSLEFSRRGLMTAAETAPSLAELDGFRLYARADDAAVGRHVLAGSYEPEVAAVFRRKLRPGMAVIDVGANIGYFTMLAASLVGAAGFVLAVEPNGANARLLEASRRLNGFAQVTVAQVAAGRGTGLLALNATHSNGTTSDPDRELEGLLGAQTVPSIALDALAGSERRFALIKIDVEGAEYNALLGAQGLIARDRPAIVSEFSPTLMPGISGIEGPDYLRWLHAQRYAVSVIGADGLEPAGQDVDKVMAAYARHGADHIDILAEPVG